MLYLSAYRCALPDQHLAPFTTIIIVMEAAKSQNDISLHGVQRKHLCITNPKHEAGSYYLQFDIAVEVS